MVEKSLYTIGQVSEICKISIKTLRYYDEIGLLKPSMKNKDNHYRHYSNQEILLAKMIQDLRDLDFSIKEIKQMLQTLDVPSIIHYIKDKREELTKQKAQLERRIGRIDAKLENFGVYSLLQTDTSPFIKLKNIPERTVAFTRRVSNCSMDSFIKNFLELLNLVEKNDLLAEGHFMAVYHEDIMTFDRSHADIEVCIPIHQAVSQIPHFVRNLPGGDYVTSFYFGDNSEAMSKKTYGAILEWLERNQYQLNGPALEIYAISPIDTVNPDIRMTELQIPVIKRS